MRLRGSCHDDQEMPDALGRLREGSVGSMGKTAGSPGHDSSKGPKAKPGQKTGRPNA